jgi:hypothetical protein
MSGVRMTSTGREDRKFLATRVASRDVIFDLSADKRGVVMRDGHRVILREPTKDLEMRSHAMAARSSIDVPGWLHEQLAQATSSARASR